MSKANRIDEPTRQAAWDELIRMIVRGQSQKEAAQLLGFHPNTVKKWVKDPEFQLKLMRTRKLIFEKTEDIIETAAVKGLENVERMIEEYSRKAVHKIGKIIDSENEHLALKASIDMADRNPKSSKIKKVQATHMHAVITPEALAMIAATARELGEDAAYGKRIEPVSLDTVMPEPELANLPAGAEEEKTPELIPA